MPGEGGWYRVLFEQLSIGVARYQRIDGTWTLTDVNHAFPPEAAQVVRDAVANNRPLTKGTIRANGPDERIVILDDTRFQQAFYGNGAAMVIAHRRDLRILDVNPRWLDLMEARREDVIGETAVALGLITEANARVRIAMHAQHPEGFAAEIPLRTRKGRDIIVLASAKPIDIAEGQCTLTTLIDITDRKQAEAAFEIAFSASPGGMILVHDATNVVVAANQRLLELVGLPRDEVVGKPIQISVLHPSREDLLEILAREGRLAGVEIQLGRGDGTSVWTLGSTERIVLNGVPHRLTAFTEITERKRLESELRELNTELEHRVRDRTLELEEANRELEAFTSSVSHDLRAPLRAIHGFSSIVLEDHANELSEQATYYLKRIKAGGERMTRLIEDLLAFARLGRTALRRSEIDLDVVVTSVVEELAVDRERLDLRIGKLGTCVGDPTLIRAVWTNLVDNALKYARERERIVLEIGCEERGGERVYFIQDNGIGFDASRADKLFGMFQRLDSARGFEGTGVGLANVRRIVEKHGGRITATAEVGHGARFELTLGT